VRGHPEVKPVAFSDSLYRILKLHTAASKQRRFAGFYVEKIIIIIIIIIKEQIKVT